MAKQAQQPQSDVRKLSSLSTSNRETKKGQSIFLAGKHGAGGGIMQGELCLVRSCA